MNKFLLLTTLSVGTALACKAENAVPLELMDLSNVTTGWRDVGVNESCEGNPLRVGRRTWAKGLGVHAPSKAVFDLEGHAVRFEATVGVDDESFGTVTFRVLGDGRELWSSGRVSAGDKVRTRDVKVDLAGGQSLTLEVTDFDGNRDGDHADWLDARVVFRDGAFGSDDPRRTRQLGALTPPASAAPRINGTSVMGVRPGRPVLWRVPVTGEAPVACTVSGLPEGLSFDPATRVISGRVPQRGEHALAVTAANAKGKAVRTLTLKVGDAVGLTPSLGWCACGLGEAATADKVKSVAEALVRSGVADHGWCYVSVADLWQDKARAADGTIRSNARFADMKGLADFLHARGLRLGLGSASAQQTARGGAGSWLHEEQDARTFAAWGCDAVSYRWTDPGRELGGSGLSRQMLPFLLMGRAVASCGRDMIFADCQDGANRVATWGRCVDATSWRVTAPVRESWRQMMGAVNQQRRLWHFSEPGRVNDAGPLFVGCRPLTNAPVLTPNELYTQVSLWTLLASPMTLVCDVENLDPLSLSLLTNDEVLEIAQDPLCAAGARVASKDRADVWVRPLSDGAFALGLVNRDMKDSEVAADLAALGFEGSWMVRDCWRQTDEGVVTGRYAKSVPGHATHLARLTPRPGARLRGEVRDVRDADWLDIFAAGR